MVGLWNKTLPGGEFFIYKNQKPYICWYWSDTLLCPQHFWKPRLNI